MEDNDVKIYTTKAEASEMKKEEKSAWDVWVESTLQKLNRRE